jgi:protein TonB
MFDDLPETRPPRSKRKLKAFASMLAFQAVLTAGFILVQMALPEKLADHQLLTTVQMAPPPPPPGLPAAEPEQPARENRKPSVKSTAPSRPMRVAEPQPPVKTESTVIAPTTVPEDIARLVESGTLGGGTAGGVPGGVPGGTPGGVLGGVPAGVLGGVLGGAAAPPVLPPPKEPVRVGGDVKPPKLLHAEQPKYPRAAKTAGVQGVVVVEAVVTAQGTVDEIKVISGHPLLIEAAKDAVSRWKYEPTVLNGEAVPVILTARINFSLSGAEK